MIRVGVICYRRALIADPDRRQALGPRSAAWVATHYTLQRQIDTTLAAYRRLLEGNRSGT